MAEPAVLRFPALGGDCELFRAGPGDLGAVRAWIVRMHDRLTRFDEASELSRLNRGAGRWVEVGPELAALLEAGLAAWAESDGLVHIGVLPALRAAGYGRDLAAGPTPTGDPIVPPPLPEMLDLAPGRARLRPGTAVDLGGLAKGWLADRAVERIGPSALANLAGDLRARGPGPGGEGWPVGFGTTTVLLRDLGAATSGTGGRRWGPGLHHLIDPRTGWPSASDLSLVSVLAPTALEAEVLAKTALLLGRAAGARLLDARSRGSYLV